MGNKFIDNQIVLKDIPKECPVDPFLLENNEKQISQICDFLQGDKKLLLVNGFRGSGKTCIVNFVSDSVNPEVLVLNYTCFETTTLDDMLLSFFERVWVECFLFINRILGKENNITSIRKLFEDF